MARTQVHGEVKNFSYFDFLSDDIILSIFQYIISFEDVYNLRRVNKRLSVIAEDKTLAHNIDCRRHYWLSTSMFETFLKPYSKYVEVLNLDNCYWLRPTDVEIFLQCSHLRSLHIMQIEVPANILCQILSNQSQLTSLSITIYDIDDFHVQLAASPGAQETLRHVVKLKLHFSNKLYHGYKPVVSFSMVSTLFDYCRDVQEIHIYGNKKSSRAVTQSIIQPHRINVDNLKNVTALTVNTNVDPIARFLFFEIFNRLCEISLNCTTLLMCHSKEDPRWNANRYKIAMDRNNELVNFEASGTNMNVSTALYNIEGRDNLLYLNLSDNQKLASDDLYDLAEHCFNLESLNLENCVHLLLGDSPRDDAIRYNRFRRLIEYSASGLESLIVSCENLRSLNLNGVHIHPEYIYNTQYRNLISLLCTNTKWQSLSLPSCCLHAKHAFCSTPEGTTQDSQANVTCQKCRLKNMNPMDPMTVLKRLNSEPETDFQRLIRLTPDMEHFELICPDFTSAFSKKCGVQPSGSAYGSCKASMGVDDCDLKDICRWNRLKSLQLTAITGVKLGYCLLTIAKGCTSLEQLYISCLGQLSHCTYIDWLVKSLPLFYKLKDFRLEQPQLAVNSNLLRAMGKCSSLERICIIALRGTFSAAGVKQLFVSLPHLMSFQLYTEEPVKKCEQLMNFLLEEYLESRPALSVCIYPLLNSNLQQVVELQVPDQHFDEMTILKSRVSIRPTE